MSESINNREHRKEVIKSIISQLHDGKSVEDVKEQFDETFADVSALEIGQVEQTLINEGMPVSEVQRLCDVHAAVFKGSIEEIHAPDDLSRIKGHPTYVLKKENRKLEKIMEKKIEPYLDDLSSKKNIKKLKSGFKKLSEIDIHYSKKENLMFPYLEKYGTTAPPQVMWGVDDEIRAAIKEVRKILKKGIEDKQDFTDKVKDILHRVREMIFKEESILIPMLVEKLTQDEWLIIKEESGEIGFIIDNIPEWNPTKEAKKEVEKEIKKEAKEEGIVTLPSGYFKVEELTAMLNALPFDITYVDKDDTVKFFSQGKERIFARTKAIIGRDVSNCHPPSSVHVVDGIVKDFKSGKKDNEDFWIKLKDGRYAYLRYFAVRNTEGEYLGVVEVSQDIAPIQEITGEKRLVE
ncbi:MAG TPA: DUF438 domain-containing protein [Clostridiales bacterium]|nr:DUF438 domain-containing protein [Clostridiales bacterium]